MVFSDFLVSTSLRPTLDRSIFSNFSTFALAFTSFVISGLAFTSFFMAAPLIAGIFLFSDLTTSILS